VRGGQLARIKMKVSVTRKNEGVAIEIFDAKRRVPIQGLFELKEKRREPRKKAEVREKVVYVH
jgi:hypothetical protein